MLSISLISLLICVPLFSYVINSHQFNRITCIVLIYSAILSVNIFDITALSSGVGIYNGLFQITSISLSMETFLFIIGSIVIIG